MTFASSIEIKKYFNTFVLSVLAGFMISFGGIVYLLCTNKIVG